MTFQEEWDDMIARRKLRGCMAVQKWVRQNKAKIAGIKRWQKENAETVKSQKRDWYHKHKDKHCCKACNYSGASQSQLERHFKTKKHQRNTNTLQESSSDSDSHSESDSSDSESESE